MAFEMQAAVRRVVNDADPMGLLEAGFPEDEYNPEVSDFVERIERGELPNPEVVSEVMRRWFGQPASDESTAIMAEGLAQVFMQSEERVGKQLPPSDA